MKTSTTTLIMSYLTYCKQNKRLDSKTIKAYRIDLVQFATSVPTTSITSITPDIIKCYIATQHQIYKPKTVKRKILHLLKLSSLISKKMTSYLLVRS